MLSNRFIPKKKSVLLPALQSGKMTTEIFFNWFPYKKFICVLKIN